MVDESTEKGYAKQKALVIRLKEGNLTKDELSALLLVHTATAELMFTAIDTSLIYTRFCIKKI